MLQQHIFLAAGWILFCVLHSVLAAINIKKRVAELKPKWFPYYRVFYTVFAFATFGAVVLYELYLSSPLLFLSVGLVRLAGWIITIVGAGIMFICVRKYFLNLSGLKSLIANEVVANELRIDGIHRFVRHPLYLGTFIFIWGAWMVFPYLSLLISNSIITGYTLLGIILEEKKLVLEFGDAYKKYMKEVPRLVPFSKRVR